MTQRNCPPLNTSQTAEALAADNSALPMTIPAQVFDAATRFADRVAIEDNGCQILYRDLPRRALTVCRAVMASGINPGDRVAIWAPNNLHWVLAALGLQMAGAVLVPLNTRMKPAEAADILRRSGTRLLFSIGDFLNTDYPAALLDYAPDCVEQLVVIGRDSQIASARLTQLGQGVNDSHPAVVPVLAWETWLARAARVSTKAAMLRCEQVKPEDLADLMFTSGTTGKPKGVMGSHGACMQAFRQFVAVLGLVPGDRYLVVNPFFHAFGYKAGWLSCLLSGATIVPQQVFDAAEVLTRIEQDKISVLPGPPTLYLSLLAHPDLPRADLSSLRAASTGAASIPPILIERMRTELGFSTVTTAYGLTECGGLASICDPAASDEVIALTSGQAINGTEIAIKASDGSWLPAGETGEICIRGFHIMQGYFDNPEATAEAIDHDGWLHTGDLGALSAEGNLTISGRLKDMFIVGGFNCYPAEIEAQLAEHPAIAQSAVIGVPDERMGEVGCAFVVLKPGMVLDSADLILWCRERMANYKVPRFVRQLEVMPVNASNKVVKPQLAALFQP